MSEKEVDAQAPTDIPLKEEDQSSNSNPPSETRTKKRRRVPLRKRLSRLLVQTAPTITVIALVLSIIQFIPAWRGAEKIDRIAESISTQYVDVFPNNMPEIISLINRTQKSLTVITDVAAYGHFSSPDNSREYIRALNDLNNSSKDVQIKILYYEPTKGKNKLSEQLATEISNWTAFTQGNAYLNYVRHYPNDAPKDADTLLNQIVGAGEKLKANLLGINPKTKVITTTDDLQIFMWIRDGEEAMFSLHNYGPNTREDSFKTIDKRFITRLEAIAGEEFKKAEGVPAPQPVHNQQGGSETGGTPTPLVTPTSSPKP